MKPKIIRPVAILILFTGAFCNTKAQVTAQDGRTYKTVKIGNQTWMAENLNVSTYRNGDSIPQFQENGKKMTFKMNVGWTSASKGAWCYYETQGVIDTTYGKLYNWFVVNDPRGLAPEGWHVASAEEWKQLCDTLGGRNIAGKKMKSTNGWKKDGNGTNESGFEAFPAGARYDNGRFGERGEGGVWWSSTKFLGMIAYYFAISYKFDKLLFSFVHKSPALNGYSIRCVKD